MATFIKGDPVPNATNYMLYENTADGQTQLALADEINFDLSTMTFEPGDHTLYVVAKAVGYSDSDPSNEVVYTVAKAATRFVFAEADTYVAGFVNKRSVHQDSDSHHYCSIPADNVLSVTITPLMVHEGATSMYYITYKSASGSTEWWVDISAVTPNEPVTVDFTDKTDGTICFNAFYDRTGAIQYPTFVDIVYK